MARPRNERKKLHQRITPVLVTAIFVNRRPGAPESLIFSPNVELFISLSAVTITAMTLGLLISVLAGKVEQAVNWNTFVAIGQIALNGVAADLSTGGVVSVFASVLPSRWGLAATASSLDLRAISPSAPSDALWDHSTSQWMTDMLWLGGLTATFFFLTVVWLSRKLQRPD